MLKDTAVEIYLAQPKGCAYGILAGANRYYDLGISDQALELFGELLDEMEALTDEL